MVWNYASHVKSRNSWVEDVWGLNAKSMLSNAITLGYGQGCPTNRHSNHSPPPKGPKFFFSAKSMVQDYPKLLDDVEEIPKSQARGWLLAVKSPLYLTKKTCQVVNCLLCFGVGLWTSCLNIKIKWQMQRERAQNMIFSVSYGLKLCNAIIVYYAYHFISLIFWFVYKGQIDRLDIIEC